MPLDVQTTSRRLTASTARLSRGELFVWLIGILATHFFLRVDAEAGGSSMRSRGLSHQGACFTIWAGMSFFSS
jgi:hypothetical protein